MISSVFVDALVVNVNTNKLNKPIVREKNVVKKNRIVTTSSSGDWWPMFRHDLAHSGYSSSVAPDTTNVRWIYKTGGDVESSPAVVYGMVYVGSYDGKLYCLNANKGDYIWSEQIGKYVYSSPAVADGKVYVGSNDGKIYYLNAYNGHIIWTFPTGGPISSSPAVADGKVYVGSLDGKLYCLNADNGTLISSYQTTCSIESSPAVADGKVYVGSLDGKIYCFAENLPPNVPSNPSPSNGATGVDIHTDLSWDGGDPDGGDNVQYWIYFGPISPPPPTPWIFTRPGSQTRITFDIPADLNPATTYYWRILTSDGEKTVVGPIWKFTTVNNPPNTPSDPNPSNGATGVSTNPTLSVYVEDPDGHSMDVTFYDGNGNKIGTDYDVGSGSRASVTWSGLEYDTTYHW